MQSVSGATLLLLALSSGCASFERSASAAQVAASESSRPLEASLVALAVPGHEPAVVSVPPETGRRHPLLVAAHGAWDRPEPHCALWRRVVGPRAFILCPRGQRTDQRVPHSAAAYYYPDHFALEREVLAAIRALSARYPRQLDASAAVWTGFSQGAIHGALVIARHPQVFPRAALVEGGNGFFDEWSPYAARKYARGAGKRVLFGCGSRSCVHSAARCAGYLDSTGVKTKIAHAQGAGHSYGPAMEATLREDFGWLVADDPRWLPD